ncbi:hypothetical protein BX600DRAFT_514160 [Xylariales sp. PMI_506]|nr:hypothetical protein BX600DRAFT_514160 [Xylariales sp. PMI_506]
MEGYAKLALLMGRHEEFAIFRRFRTLNMQNLLYMQAEITELEDQLKKIVQQDTRDTDKSFYAKDWWSLSQSPEDVEKTQWNKCLAIRTKLKEYNEALVQMVNLAKAEVPTAHDIDFLRGWMIRPSMGNFALLGLDRDSYSLEHTRDLIAMNSRPGSDLFSRWFTDRFIPKYHQFIGHTFKSTTSEDLGCGLYDYQESLLSCILRVGITVIASMLPICSVVVLYFAQNALLRLGIVVIASGLFALALALMTYARAIEVFAATSAFAAVNVVFLTSQGSINT